MAGSQERRHTSARKSSQKRRRPLHLFLDRSSPPSRPYYTQWFADDVTDMSSQGASETTQVLFRVCWTYIAPSELGTPKKAIRESFRKVQVGRRVSQAVAIQCHLTMMALPHLDRPPRLVLVIKTTEASCPRSRRRR